MNANIYLAIGCVIVLLIIFIILSQPKKKTVSGMLCPYPHDFTCPYVVDVYLTKICSECEHYNNGIKPSRGILSDLFTSKKKASTLNSFDSITDLRNEMPIEFHFKTIAFLDMITSKKPDLRSIVLHEFNDDDTICIAAKFLMKNPTLNLFKDKLYLHCCMFLNDKAVEPDRDLGLKMERLLTKLDKDTI